MKKSASNDKLSQKIQKFLKNFAAEGFRNYK